VGNGTKSREVEHPTQATKEPLRSKQASGGAYT
jgi:hypothetical protein